MKNQNQSVIFEFGCLVSVKARKWGSSTRIENDDVNLHLPKRVFSVQARLIKGYELGRVERWAMIAHHVLHLNSFDWGNSRFVPNSVLPKLLDRLEGIKTKFNEASKEFIKVYPKRLEEALTQLKKEGIPESIIQKLRESYPKDVSDKFGWNVTIFSLSLPSSSSLKVLKTTEAYVKARTEDDMLQKLQKEAQVKIEGFLKDSLLELQKRITDTLTKFASSKKISERGITKIKDFLDEAKKLNFLEAKSLTDGIESARKALSISPSTKEDRASLQESISKVVEVVSKITDDSYSEVVKDFQKGVGRKMRF